MDLTYYDLERIPSPECEECGGTGEWHTVIRWDHRGCGGPAPVERRDECEACYGTGLEGCYKHENETPIARHRDESSLIYCPLCIEEMVAELERYGQEGEAGETIAALAAILKAYEMEVMAA
jgi:hypothetical protein